MTRQLITTFTIQGPPVSWERAGTRTGRYYTPARTKAGEDAVACAFKAAPKLVPYDFDTAKFRLEVDAYLPTLRQKDWDNLGKLVSDGLNKIAYRDDSQIWSGESNKFLDRENPRTVVRLYLME